MPLGPGADEEEDLESAWAISCVVRGGADLCGRSLGGGEKAALGGKKCPSRASFICSGVLAAGEGGKQAWGPA